VRIERWTIRTFKGPRDSGTQNGATTESVQLGYARITIDEKGEFEGLIINAHPNITCRNPAQKLH
jgi:hypothetical protein